MTNKDESLKKKEDDGSQLSTYVYKRDFMDNFKYIIGNLLYAQVLAGASTFGCVYASFLMFTGERRKANPYAAYAAKVLGDAMLNIKVTVLGGKEYLDCERPAVFVCNHQNFLDLYLLGYVFPNDCVIMAKSDLKYMPFIGQFLTAGDNIFIERDKRDSALDTMKYVGEELKKKKMGIFMYPEGTRSHQTTNDLLPFKKGAFHLAISGQMPVVPIVISTYGDICNGKQYLFRGGEVKVKFLPPISTKGMTLEKDLDTLTESTRTQMLQTLREISRPVKISAKL